MNGRRLNVGVHTDTSGILELFVDDIIQIQILIQYIKRGF